MRSPITITNYTPAFKEAWDSCIDSARNGLFWCKRDFLEYHGNRFLDASLVFSRAKGGVLGVLPAHLEGEVVISHAGLPFAGFVLMPNARLLEVDTMLQLTKDNYARAGCRKLVMHFAPDPYASLPTHEVEYLLHKRGAVLAQNRLTSMILLNDQGIPRLISRSRIKKMDVATKRFPMRIAESERWEDAWPMLEAFLKRRFARKPLHSFEDITRLCEKFPSEIRLILAETEDRVIGGQVAFLFPQVVRMQYVFRNDEAVMDYLQLRLDLAMIEVIGGDRKQVDMGTSYCPADGSLQASLYEYKEHVGARGVALRTWEWSF